MVETEKKEVGVIQSKTESVKLIQAAKKGEQAAFVRLVALHKQSMYATAMAVTHNEDDALDAIQDTILTLWEKLDTLRNPDYFKTWMTKILVNKCCTMLRGNAREVAVEEEIGGSREEDLDTPLDVQAALHNLSQDDSLILQLFYFEDLSLRQIADVLSITAGAAKMRLTRSRKRFLKQYNTQEVGL